VRGIERRADHRLLFELIRVAQTRCQIDVNAFDALEWALE
jgi:hypothetical protein